MSAVYAAVTLVSLGITGFIEVTTSGSGGLFFAVLFIGGFAWIFSLLALAVSGYGFIIPSQIATPDDRGARSLGLQLVGSVAIVSVVILVAGLLFDSLTVLEFRLVDIGVVLVVAAAVSSSLVYGLLRWAIDSVGRRAIAAHVVTFHLASIVAAVLLVLLWVLFWIVVFELSEPDPV